MSRIDWSKLYRSDRICVKCKQYIRKKKTDSCYYCDRINVGLFHIHKMKNNHKPYKVWDKPNISEGDDNDFQ